MIAAAHKEIMQKALALPRKARLNLLRKIMESLEAPEEKISRKEWNRLWKAEALRRAEEMDSGKVKGIPGDRVMAELTAVYGKTKETEPSISRKEWNKAWKTELERRIEDLESGRVECVPYAEVRKKLDRILRKA